MKKHLPLVLILLFTFALILISCTEDNITPTPTIEPGTGATPESSLPTTEEIPDISLNHKELNIKAGESLKLEAQINAPLNTSQRIIFASDNSSVVYIDQDGNVIGLEAGSAKITVKTESGHMAICPVTVSANEDLFDKLDLTNATKIEWTYFEGDGFYADDKGNITFTPTVWDFQQCLKFGTSSYRILLRIKHLPSKDFPMEYTFPSISVEPKKFMGSNTTINLFTMAKGNDGTFCPISGEIYEIDFIFIKKSTNEALFYGKFENVEAEKDIKNSKYYSPSIMPGYIVKEEGEVYLTYKTTEGGYINGGNLQAHKPGEAGFEVTAVAKDGYKFFMWNDGLKDAVRKDTAEDEDTKYTAFFIKDSTEDMPIPNMYIFTDTGSPVTTKDYVGADMIIVGARDSRDDISARLQIKGRGNSSWNASAPQNSYDSKNSYRIKLDEKENLLSIGEDKNRDWVLNSNKFDLSGLRNYLVWQLAERMGSLPFVPDCQWVQLYVNSEYRGMYMVTELIEVASGRIEVDDKIESTDKGYLIEIDFRGTEENDPYFYVSGYGAASNDNPREFVVKSECTDEDLAFIADYIRRCHDAIVSGDRNEIDKLIDLASFIDMYILEELAKDVDVGAASFFMQKDPGGKIYFTAPWDFDFGFGTYGKAVSYDEMVSYKDSGCTWYSALVEHEWFREEVLKRMNELEDEFKDTLKAVKDKADELETSADKNANFWKMYGSKYHPYVSSNVSSQLNSYDEHIDYIVNWTECRWDVMIEFLKTGTLEKG